ncbi:MAG: RluA family pseudouridine synthase [Candidatus Omnitrophica bacterium]|nr:RluA family pseudouridine synthase [Candidatus Omnitrophota bacterium]
MNLQERVLHEDDHLRVLNKPSGYSVLKDNTGAASLADLYEDSFGEPPLWVHRLDKGTSGVLLVARTPECRAELQRQFDKGTIEKTYLALVSGSPPKRKGTIDLPLEKARKGRFRIASPGRGVESITDYEVVGVGATTSLLICRPKTGRTHQIRVHLQEHGSPLATDPLYGYLRGKPSENPHLTLHSWKIRFQHPETGTRMEMVAEEPDWARADLD